MARLFDDASTEYLYINTGILTAVPISIGCWFNFDADVTGCLVFLGDKDINNRYFNILAYNAAGGHIIRAITRQDTAVHYADSGSAFTLNTWRHALAVFAAVDDRRVYLDGGSKGTNAGSATPSGVDKFAVGVQAAPSADYYMSGHIGEVVIWDGVVTDDEAAVLGKGYSPRLVQPQNIVGYWSLIRDLNDEFGGYNLTASGTIVSAHPRVIVPCGAL